MIGRRGVVAVSVGALVATGAAVQLLPGGAPVARATGLTAYSSCADLLEHYRAEMRATATPYGFGYDGQVRTGGDIATATSGDVATATSGAESARQSGAVGTGATGTNLQEQGVDEPDLVKLRDGRLVVLAQNALQVLSAEAEPRLLGSLRLDRDRPADGSDGKPYGGMIGGSYGAEVLLVGDRALVVVPGFREEPQMRPDAPSTDAPSSDANTPRLSIYLPGVPTTRLVLIDLSSDEPRLLAESTYDGQYVSARLVGGTVRLVTTTGARVRGVQPMTSERAAETDALAANRRAAGALTLADVLPRVVRTDRDGTVVQSGNAVDCRQTVHARNPRGTSTLLVTTLQPGDGLAATDSTAVTTDGDLVYASEERLYVATSRWGTVGPVRPLDDTVRPGAATSMPAVDEASTEIHAFDTSSETSTRYVGTGSVPGYVLGRWALSEHEGALRVATTRQPPWTGEADGESSSIVVKMVERDGALVETGRVSGLGRTEQIKAVRYFGDVAAVVTFRQTDPLYLLDLSGTPKVLGELKVPGFSTYLHPIGDGRLLGLGQDADKNGQVTGMQVSVFDISDLANPSLVDRLPLGYGWSPALDDSRAFSYDPEQGLAVFAFSGYDPEGRKMAAHSAVGVSVDEDGRLREAGRMDSSDPGNPPSRVVLDGDRVYAVGEAEVVTGSAETMSRTGSVSLTAR